MSVLIVDDEPAVRDILARWVTSLGLRPETATNADEALATLRARPYDLAVIDVMMPGHNGLWLASQLRLECPHTALVIATGYTELLDPEDDTRPFADLLVKPFQRDRFVLALDRGRQWRKRALEEGQWCALLSSEIGKRAGQIATSLQRREAEGASALAELDALAAERTPGTAAHGERVARHAMKVARELEAEAEFGAELDAAARLHDVGKVAMPDALLSKPSPLTSDEMAIMRRHVEVGADILSVVSSLSGLAPIVRASHEWFSGGGYPRNLSGGAIPLASRIIAVADAYDVMTHDRAYRVQRNASEAVAELLRCSPAQFDPEVVDAFLAVLAQH